MEGRREYNSMFKAEAEIKTGSLGNESAIAMDKERKHAKEDWEALCNYAGDFAKTFVESKESKKETVEG